MLYHNIVQLYHMIVQYDKTKWGEYDENQRVAIITNRLRRK